MWGNGINFEVRGWWALSLEINLQQTLSRGQDYWYLVVQWLRRTISSLLVVCSSVPSFSPTCTTLFSFASFFFTDTHLLSKPVLLDPCWPTA